MDSRRKATFSRGVLDAGAVEQIHELALRILEKTGVQVDDADTQALLKCSGARETGEAGRFRLPRGLIADALAAAPRPARPGERHGCAAEVGPGAPPVFWTGAALLKVEDREGRARPIDRAWLE